MPAGYSYVAGAGDNTSRARFDLAIADVTDADTAILSDIEIAAEVARYGYEMGVSALASHLYGLFAQEVDSVGIAGAVNVGLAGRVRAWDKLRQDFLAYRARLAATATDTGPPVTMPPLRRARVQYDDAYTRR